MFVSKVELGSSSDMFPGTGPHEKRNCSRCNPTSELVGASLLYCRKKQVEKILSMEESCTAMKCVHKRKNPLSMESTEMDVARMLDRSDTEAEQGPTTKICRQTDKDQLDDIASSCIAETTRSLRLPVSEIDYTGTDQEVEVTFVTAQGTSSKQAEPEIMQKIDCLMNTCRSLHENQNTLSNAIQSPGSKVLQKFANAMFDSFIKGLDLNPCDNDKAMEFVMITDKKSLDEFEEKLKDQSFQIGIKNKLSIGLGKGKGRGYNNAYALSDVMFSRKFLTECSWTGGSRKDIPKICFKVYTNTINLFFNVIHQSDNGYTKFECETFWKSLLRNSNKRNKDIQRASGARRRPKKQMQTNIGNHSTGADSLSVGPDNQLPANHASNSDNTGTQPRDCPNQPSGENKQPRVINSPAPPNKI